MLTSFLKMTSAVYVAATLALLSFLFHLDSASSFSSRISFLAGALFATVVNMRVASSELQSNIKKQFPALPLDPVSVLEKTRFLKDQF